jgi:hypothetical protein
MYDKQVEADREERQMNIRDDELLELLSLSWEGLP